MQVLNIPTAEKILHSEYPHLEFKITKQFSSKGPQKRTYNTFLLQTSNNELVIAKSFVVNPETLELEWKILQQLNTENKDAPRLLFPDIKPKTFLLMEYINAKDASNILRENPNDLRVFELIGTCLGKFHTTKEEWFGNPINKEKFYDDWEGLMKDKVDNRVSGLKNILDAHEHTKIANYYTKIRDDFLNDAISEPVLLHRDIYIENFLIDDNKKVTLIDYGLAYGGRPWYDLAKLYIADLSEYPNAKDIFLREYEKFISIPNNFTELIKYYIFAELTGMLLSHKRYEHDISYKRRYTMLMDFIAGTGVISELVG